MKYLKPTTDNQTLFIIPRVYATNLTLTLRDDSTNNTVTIIPSVISNRNYLEVTSSFNLVEGRFYDLKIYNGQGDLSTLNVIYRDKVFCTVQDTDQSNNEYYTVNKSVYKEESGNNDYIIL